MKRRLLWQIYPAFLVITVLGLLAISWNVSILIKNFYYAEKRQQLEQLASLGLSVLDSIENERISEIHSACKEMGKASGVRFTVIDLSGKVLGESDESPVHMENHFNRPEFQQALKGQVGQDIRSSSTLEQPMMYVAVPIVKDGQVVSVLRTAVEMAELKNTLHSVNTGIFKYGLLIAGLLAVLSLIFSWKISRPMELLRKGAERFARGDLSHRLPVPASREIGALAQSMNEMAAQLDERIRTVISQKNEQQAVLSSMIEGVVAVSSEGKIMSINNAAAQMLQVDMAGAAGRTIEEIIRNTDLQQFIQCALDSDEVIEGQVVLHEQSQSEQFLQAHGSNLIDDKGQKIGELLVLNDMTHLRRLEQVRRDFVANVSHELKTPVTSIKGFIETLLDGAMQKPEDGRRFLEIIGRQTNRLNSIIDDLLMLSRIEQQSERVQFELEAAKIKPIITAAAGLCEISRTEKNIQIEIDCDENITAHVNASLLEQAIVNLIDNAIKYSDNDSRVRIEVIRTDEQIFIHVSDNGCGISREHLPRLFERFYRVDKARSRKLGGTGLGLAIVKHIAQSHKGQVKVSSVVGQGSIFTINLPLLPKKEDN